MSKALAGRRVVVTRPEGKAEHLIRLLRDRGAEVVHFPTIAIEDPPSWENVDAAANKLEQGVYEWVVFTSANAVEKFVGRLGSGDALASTRVAAVGTATSAALERHDVEASVVPREYTGAAIATALGRGSGNVLLPRVEGGPRTTVEALQAQGWSVDEVVAYRNVMYSSNANPLPDVFDAVTFASGSAARNFAAMVDIAALRLDLERSGGPPLVVCIGPSTATEAQRAGMRVDVVADVHTDEGMVDALEAHLASLGH